MPTVSSIILETLRLYPAVPQVSRVAAADVVLHPPESAGSSHPGPLRILKGTSVVIPIAALHRDSVSAM